MYDDGADDVDGGNDSHKPRRLEEDTITYLMQLDKQIHADALDPDEQEVLVENVLDEIKQRTASAACDRRTNLIMERLCYAAKLKHLVEILSRFTPYAVFLARNRHSSHIIQALLARLCFLLKNEGVAGVDEELLKRTTLGFLSLILKEISWLAKELSASHVVRSALCALAGVPIVAERKGKGSKHQHSVSLSEPLESLLAPGGFYLDKGKAFAVPDEFHEALGEAAASLLGLGAQELQGLVADPSSCAVVGLLLRVLFAPDLVEGGPDLADRLARTALGAAAAAAPADDADLLAVKALPVTANMFYAMAGDRSGSYFLEAVVECCAPPLLLELVHGAVQGSAHEYAQDGAGNFVLQAVLRRLSAELERSARGAAEMAALAAAADKCLAELSSKDFYPYLVLQRGGVVLWMLELARWRCGAAAGGGEKAAKKAKADGADAAAAPEDWRDVLGHGALALWTGSDDSDTKLAAVVADKLSPKAAAAAAPEDAKNSKKPTGSAADRDSAQQLAARLLGALLRLAGKGRALSPASAAARVARAVAALPAGTLRHVATSGPLSRAVLDTFLEYCGTTGDADADAAKPTAALLASLTALAVDLADHSIGQHVLRRAYESADARAKEGFAAALAAAKDRLGATKEGRNSLRIVQAETYARQPEEWRAALRRQSRAQGLLEDLGATDASGRPARPTFMDGKTFQEKAKGGHGSGSSSSSDAGKNVAAASAAGKEEDGGAGASGGKRKRKRKRKGGAGTGAAGDDDNDDDDDPPPAAPAAKPAQPAAAGKAAPAKKADMALVQKLKQAKAVSLADVAKVVAKGK